MKLTYEHYYKWFNTYRNWSKYDWNKQYSNRFGLMKSKLMAYRLLKRKNK